MLYSITFAIIFTLLYNLKRYIRDLLSIDYTSY
mgnify:CR=1 FL=1